MSSLATSRNTDSGSNNRTTSGHSRPIHNSNLLCSSNTPTSTSTRISTSHNISTGNDPGGKPAVLARAGPRSLQAEGVNRHSEYPAGPCNPRQAARTPGGVSRHRVLSRVIPGQGASGERHDRGEGNLGSGRHVKVLEGADVGMFRIGVPLMKHVNGCSAADPAW